MTAIPDTSTVVSSVRDPVRIVPLHVPDDLVKPLDGAAASAPKLTYRGGPLLTSVKVFTVYWGDVWSTLPLSDLASKLDKFFDFVLTSELMDQMTEYSVAGKKIGHGSHIGRVVVSDPAPKQVVSDATIQHLLERKLGDTQAGFPPADGNTLYFIYLPPGSVVVQGGSRSCQAFCGYHSDIDGKIFYAAMPYPGCRGCTGNLALFDALTSTSSHELCEAITDPVPGGGWYDDAHGEIGDICAWKTRQLGGFTVQLEWSNNQNKCV
ncbi:MAG: hypothetical protein WBV74_18210 [Pseudonocardiaceae bacterium]